MEKRITAQGPKDRKSYTITLPIQWVKQAGLDKTRTAFLEIVGNNAVICPSKGTPQRICIKGEDYRRCIIKVMQGLYRLGIDEVSITTSDNKQVEELIDIIDKKLIGFEIVEQKKDRILIKDITNESSEGFDVIMRRVFLLLIELAETENGQKITALDRNIKKLINFCQRTIMKSGHSDFRRTPIYYLMLDRLEKMCDELKWALRAADNKKDIEILRETKACLRAAYELFYNFENKKYAYYQYKTYELFKRGDEKRKGFNLHWINLMRVLNSLLGDIFMLKYSEA